MAGKDLNALFLHQLKDTYFAENAILKVTAEDDGCRQVGGPQGRAWGPPGGDGAAGQAAGSGV